MGQPYFHSSTTDVDIRTICAHSYVGYANALAYAVSIIGREPCKVLCDHMRLRGGNAVVWPDSLSYDFNTLYFVVRSSGVVDRCSDLSLISFLMLCLSS